MLSEPEDLRQSSLASAVQIVEGERSGFHEEESEGTNCEGTTALFSRLEGEKTFEKTSLIAFAASFVESKSSKRLDIFAWTAFLLYIDDAIFQIPCFRCTILFDHKGIKTQRNKTKRKYGAK